MNGKPIIDKPILMDRFGRVHNYLRLSIVDKCNFSCNYCKPHSSSHNYTPTYLKPEEIYSITRILCGMGINKIRITGGEPLLNKYFKQIAEYLSELNVELGLTTNGFFLDSYFEILRKNNINNLNISLDTLNPQKFQKITGKNSFKEVYRNINKAIRLGFNVKINAVIIRGVNDDELIDFANLTIDKKINVRFIEFMPFKANNWEFGNVYSSKDILNTITNHYHLKPDTENKNETSVYHQIAGASGKIGIISTFSKPFCDTCNRIRITADGKLKSCLFGLQEYDLITPLREGNCIETIVNQTLMNKSSQHGGRKPFQSSDNAVVLGRSMYSIGG